LGFSACQSSVSDVLCINNKIQQQQQNTATASRHKVTTTLRNNATTAMGVITASTAEGRSNFKRKSRSDSVDNRAAAQPRDSGNNGATASNLGLKAAVRTGGKQVLNIKRGQYIASRAGGGKGTRIQGGGKGTRGGPPPEAGTCAHRRWRRRPGEAALAEIRIMQKSTGLIIPKAAVSRLVWEVTESVHTKQFWWTVNALEAIHEALPCGC
jgi:hypothetical protein